MASESLRITDNRTGKSYEIAIRYGTYPTYGAAIDASALRQIKVSDEDFGLLSYDPGFTNTASCRSAISFVDGERGILRYRGYPIEQLAERSNYLETAHLLLHGELPNRRELEEWTHNITHHTIIHENIKKFIDGFHHDAHPMGVLVGTVGALSTFYPEAKEIHDDAVRWKQIWRLIEDEYFVSRKLYPNVDFYSGIIYQAMGFPVDMFPVLFAIPRTAGWLAQWQEMLLDPDTRIARPRQVYTGSDERPYVPANARTL